MPWYGEVIPVTSGIDLLVNLLRLRIYDQKTLVNNIVMENTGLTSSGGTPETFYTTKLPIASGYDTKMYIDRWVYTAEDNELGCTGLRAYVFNVESGSYYVPTGATPGVSGGKVFLNYSWEEDQEYKFADGELKLYIQDAVTTTNNSYYDFGQVVSGVGSATDIAPMPGVADISSYLYVMYATYLIRQQLESEGFDKRIYVKDLNVTIDTSKGLGDLSKSSKILLDQFKDVIGELKMKGQEAAFAKIDTYSTYSSEYDDTQYESNYHSDDEFFSRK